MGTGPSLSRTMRAFIKRQQLFFVATADVTGRVNVSPKGLDTLRLIDDRTIRWLNLSGSGNETAAHVQATGRMTLMFCGFDGPAMIVRVYGSAVVIHPRHRRWGEIAPTFPTLAGSRQIFELSIDLVQTSCGSGVPFMEYKGCRGDKELLPYYESMGPEGVQNYWARKNTTTIDGAPTGIFDDV